MLRLPDLSDQRLKLIGETVLLASERNDQLLLFSDLVAIVLLELLLLSHQFVHQTIELVDMVLSGHLSLRAACNLVSLEPVYSIL